MIFPLILKYLFFRNLAFVFLTFLLSYRIKIISLSTAPIMTVVRWLSSHLVRNVTARFVRFNLLCNTIRISGILYVVIRVASLILRVISLTVGEIEEFFCFRCRFSLFLTEINNIILRTREMCHFEVFLH